MPPRQLAAVQGGARTARPHQARRGKGGRRERAAPALRAAPPPRPSFTPAASGAGRAAPPHPGPAPSAGSSRRRRGPPHLEAAGGARPGRAGGAARRKPGGGRGSASAAASQRPGPAAVRVERRWCPPASLGPRRGRPGPPGTCPGAAAPPRHGPGRERCGGWRGVFLLLPEIQRRAGSGVLRLRGEEAFSCRRAAGSAASRHPIVRDGPGGPGRPLARGSLRVRQRALGPGNARLCPPFRGGQRGAEPA